MMRMGMLARTTMQLLLCGLLCTHAQAEKADANKPTEVKAEQMMFDDANQISSFTGNVIVTRGSLLLKANKVVLSQDAAGYQFAHLHGSPSNLAVFRQKREGADLWVEGRAERIEYDGKSELIKLYSHAKLTRLQGKQVSDEVSGEFIVYDSKTEFFTVQNSASGKDGNNRTKTVIQPRSQDTPQDKQ